MSIEPLVAEAADPDESTTLPLDTAPLLPAVEMWMPAAPPAMATAPPLAVDAAADKTTDPDVELSPARPAITEMLPDDPALASPVAITTPPEAASSARPVASDTTPLEEPELLCTRTSPLVPAVLAPLPMATAPPTASCS
jgi:hypothetical protein